MNVQHTGHGVYDLVPNLQHASRGVDDENHVVTVDRDATDFQVSLFRICGHAKLYSLQGINDNLQALIVTFQLLQGLTGSCNGLLQFRCVDGLRRTLGTTRIGIQNTLQHSAQPCNGLHGLGQLGFQLRVVSGFLRLNRDRFGNDEQ